MNGLKAGFWDDYCWPAAVAVGALGSFSELGPRGARLGAAELDAVVVGVRAERRRLEGIRHAPHRRALSQFARSCSGRAHTSRVDEVLWRAGQAISTEAFSSIDPSQDPRRSEHELPSAHAYSMAGLAIAGRLAAGQEPAAAGCYQRDADDDEDEGEYRDPTEIVEVVEVGRREDDVEAPATPSSAPRSASAPAVAAVSVRRILPVAPVAVSVRRSPALSLRISPTVTGQDRERQEGPRGGRDGDRPREGGALSRDFDREAGLGGKLARGGDLLARQRPARLHGASRRPPASSRAGEDRRG